MSPNGKKGHRKEGQKMKHVKRVIVVLGNQLDKEGRLVAWFKERLKTGFDLLRNEPNSVMIITGGQTRAGFPSESEEGRRFLIEHGLGFGQAGAELGARILVETEARSTSDHPGLVRELLEREEIEAEEFIFVTSIHHVWRSRRLFQKYWTESQQKAEWVGVGHSTTIDWVLEVGFYLVELLCPPLAREFMRRYRNDTR